MNIGYFSSYVCTYRLKANAEINKVDTRSTLLGEIFTLNETVKAFKSGNRLVTYHRQSPP